MRREATQAVRSSAYQEAEYQDIRAIDSKSSVCFLYSLYCHVSCILNHGSVSCFRFSKFEIRNSVLVPLSSLLNKEQGVYARR